MKKLKLLNYALAGTLLLGGLFGSVSPSYASSLGDDVANRADNYLGYDITNYSSAYFVSYVFGKEGMDVSSSLTSLSKEGKLILNKNSLQPGDVVFFGTSPQNLIAAGIYSGNNQVIVAYKPYKTVKQISLNSSLGQKYFLGAKRISSTSSANQTTPTNTNSSSMADKVISAGKKYLGTPYEYGSSRSNTKTFDCSDFVHQAFLDGVGLKLPSSSSTQAAYVKNLGHTTTNWRNLQPGDLLFFMSYRGPKESDYKGINLSKQSINHVAIYLGDGKILHTYSKKSGGVRIDSIAGTHWEYRFIFGGSAFK